MHIVKFIYFFSNSKKITNGFNVLCLDVSAGVTAETIQTVNITPEQSGSEVKIQEEEHDLVDEDISAGKCYSLYNPTETLLLKWYFPNLARLAARCRGRGRQDGFMQGAGMHMCSHAQLLLCERQACVSGAVSTTTHHLHELSCVCA